jgi:putative spermidine/putrescine transport system substrate-binding protein
MSRHWKGVLAAAILTGSSSGVALAADSVTVASWGGSYQEAQQKAFFKPTADALGITIKEDTTNGLDDVRLQVTGNAVKWDLVELSADECARGTKEGLFEKLDYNVIDAAGIDPKLVQDDWVGITYYSVVLIYRTDVFGENGPKTWSDFWNVEKFPYPLDIDRALKSLDKIRPHIDAWWTSGAQAMQLIKDGEVDMASIWNGRASTLKMEGAPIAYSYDQGVLNADCMVIPKGAKNKDAAMKVLASFLKPEIQANLPLYIANGPANVKAFETGNIPADKVAEVTSAPENAKKQVLMDPSFWADHMVEAQEQFDNLVQQ